MSNHTYRHFHTRVTTRLPGLLKLNSDFDCNQCSVKSSTDECAYATLVHYWQDEKTYHLLRFSYSAVAETYNLHFLGTVGLLLIVIRQRFLISVGHAAVKDNYARKELWAVSIERW